MCPTLPSRHRCRTDGSLSGDRTWKRPLTHRLKSFAVWHRLPQNSPASPRGPFMVELFTVSLLTRSPRLSAPVRLVAKSKLPTPDRLNEVCDPEPPCAGLRDMMNSQSEFPAFDGSFLQAWFERLTDFRIVAGCRLEFGSAAIPWLPPRFEQRTVPCSLL